MQMQRALLPARARFIAVPIAAQLPRRSAVHGETAKRLSAPPRGRRSASPQGERDG
jgi:hypothetical protein